MNKLFEKFKNMSAEEIMKVQEIQLVETGDTKRVNEEEFEFTFLINGMTDPEWRTIFYKIFGSKIVKIHGSELSLTCKSTDIESLLPKVKLSIISTNAEYMQKRESLIAEINSKNEEARVSAINKNIEDSEVQRMFNDLKL